MGTKEGYLAWELGGLLKIYLVQNDIGVGLGADSMMRIAPSLVRIPDLSFVSWDKLPDRLLPEEPVAGLVPDLAVEILSEGNTPAEMKRKVGEYFDAGVRLVWLIDPKKRMAQDLHDLSSMGHDPRGAVARRRRRLAGFHGFPRRVVAPHPAPAEEVIDAPPFTIAASICACRKTRDSSIIGVWSVLREGCPAHSVAKRLARRPAWSRTVET